MTTFPRTFVEFAAWVARPLGRLATVILGFVTTWWGWRERAIVMFPMGVTLALLGIAVFLCGLVAPPVLTKS